jgi:hypothetical protein
VGNLYGYIKEKIKYRNTERKRREIPNTNKRGNGTGTKDKGDAKVGKKIRKKESVDGK